MNNYYLHVLLTRLSRFLGCRWRSKLLAPYEEMENDINALMTFLKKLNIEASIRSHLEDDYLEALTYVEHYQNGREKLLSDKGRSALGGLHQLYKWIFSIKDCSEFEKIIPHLKMLSESATRINSSTPMYNPSTNMQDDKTNKLIETIIAMYAIKVGSNVDIDDPITSSGGNNPDIMFDYGGKRIAIACKTLRTTSPSKILENLQSAAKQIKRAKCDIGYIAINVMNIIPHDDIKNKIFDSHQEPLLILVTYIEKLYASIKDSSTAELLEIFNDQKISPTTVTFIHSTTRLKSHNVNVSTMLKGTFTKNFISDNIAHENIEVLLGINEFIHNRPQR